MEAYIRNQSRRAPERVIEEAIPVNKNGPATVTNVFSTNIEGHWRNVTIIWCTKNLVNISFTITIDGKEGDLVNQTTCKVELKPWQFWSKKGYKSIENDYNVGHQLEVYWDLRSAKFSGNSPEPCSDYYIALVSNDEILLLIGDHKKKAFKRIKKRPTLTEAVQSLKKEVVYAKKSFSTRARFVEGKGENDVVVESSIGPKEPEMWISIDGIVLIHVQNLQWKFRGNETVMVNKQSIQVFWDVHAWLFCSPGSGYGLFIFKPGPIEPEFEREGSNVSGSSDDSTSIFYSSTISLPKVVEFCLFLQAWKVE